MDRRALPTVVAAAVAAAAVGGYLLLREGDPEPATGPGDLVTARIADRRFPAEPVVAGEGALVEFRNDDTVPHTVTAEDGSFDSGRIPAGAGFTFSFIRRGTYGYHCTVHPAMRGTLRVG